MTAILSASSATRARYRVLSTADHAAWLECLAGLPNKELVHFPHYCRVYERYGDGRIECFVYEHGDSRVLYPIVRRPIEGGEPHTDFITPYGYGGIAYACGPETTPAALIQDFRLAFAQYARDTSTVSEFVRFHPRLANHVHFQGLMDQVAFSCNNALIDLSVGPAKLFTQYRPSFQQCIRKAEATGLTVGLVPAPEFIDRFFPIYIASMERKHQEGYLKFRRDFLVFLSEELGSSLKCFAVEREGETQAIALFLHHGNNVEYFLSASRPETLALRPNHLLLHTVALWSIEAGAQWFHLGGGHKSLQFFKQGFANSSCDYYVGKHVFDHQAYEQLSIEHWRRHGRTWTPEAPFFPGYRAEFRDE